MNWFNHRCWHRLDILGAMKLYLQKKNLAGLEKLQLHIWNFAFRNLFSIHYTVLYIHLSIATFCKISSLILWKFPCRIKKNIYLTGFQKKWTFQISYHKVATNGRTNSLRRAPASDEYYQSSQSYHRKPGKKPHRDVFFLFFLQQWSHSLLITHQHTKRRFKALLKP